jgi:hypothetical protein
MRIVDITSSIVPGDIIYHRLDHVGEVAERKLAEFFAGTLVSMPEQAKILREKSLESFTPVELLGASPNELVSAALCQVTRKAFLELSIDELTERWIACVGNETFDEWVERNTPTEIAA